MTSLIPQISARFTPLGKIATGFLLLLMVALLDIFAPDELQFFIFYFVPVAFVAWFFNRMAASIAAVICAMLWQLIETPHWESTPVYFAINALLRILSLSVIAIVFSEIRAARDRQERMLKELELSNARIKQLQNEVQTVCAWTKRIKDEGKWITLEQFMQRHFHLQFSHGISEEARQKLEQEFKEEEQEVSKPVEATVK